MKQTSNITKRSHQDPINSRSRKVIGFIALATVFTTTLACNTQAQTEKISQEKITLETPFEMPAITIPDFSGCPRFSIKEFGAKKDDKASTTKAIADAIEKAGKAGGGVVVIPDGEWLTGAIHLKSNVNLHLEDKAILVFSEDPEDYLPAVQTTWEGMECFNYSPLIYAFGCKNIAITGKGTLRAKLDIWKVWYARPKAHMEALKRLYTMASKNKRVKDRQMVGDDAHLRPQFIQFNRCEHVLLEDVSIRNSPFWVIHPFLSKDVVIRNVNVYARGHNNDGVDPEMSENVLIENCVFNQGDDMIAVKSGRNQDGWRLDTPSKNIVIRNCTLKNGHQVIAIGSELSGGVENVLVEDVNVDIDESDKNAYPFQHIAFIKTNERRGGYVKNIFVRNIKADTTLAAGVLGIETDVLYQWKNLVPTYKVKLTPISDIFLENIEAGSVKYIARIQGQSAKPVKDVSLKNIKADQIREEKYQNDNVKRFRCDDD